jgi:pimeloyl-ACP methyl ester carboxylesterase
MLKQLPLQPWKSQLGAQRDWFWRGWRIRYTVIRPAQTSSSSLMPILLIHGFGSALTQWHANLEPLSEQHPVYAIDLLGFGASEKGAAHYNVPLWADLVHDFWATVVQTPMILIGHSLGALVAATATAQYPDMVQGLVMITLPATRQELLPARWLQPLVSNLEGLFASPLLIGLIFKIARQPGFIRAVLRRIYVNRDCVTDNLVASFVLPTGDRGSAQTLCRLTRATTQTNYSPSRKKLLTTIGQPMLLIWGQNDNVVPISQAESLAKLNPQITVATILGAGHCPYDEQNQIVNATVLNWIDTQVMPDS